MGNVFWLSFVLEDCTDWRLLSASWCSCWLAWFCLTCGPSTSRAGIRPSGLTRIAIRRASRIIWRRPIGFFRWRTLEVHPVSKVLTLFTMLNRRTGANISGLFFLFSVKDFKCIKMLKCFFFLIKLNDWEITTHAGSCDMQNDGQHHSCT